MFKRNVQAVNEIKAITERIERKLPQLAINWVLSHPAVSTALVGARNITEVEENMGAVGWALDDEIKYEIDRIFAPFVRLREDVTEGSGLGLTLVRSLVELYGGNVHIKSAKEGNTTVHVTIPEAIEQNTSTEE